MQQINLDKKFISYCINLAKKNLGTTAPNPVVGCIIVKDDQIISSGVTAKNGRPHAESLAIERVHDKKNLEGATLYVSLEPCFHTGLTPPCVDEIIKYKIGRVVIATKDIDERVSGRSISKLRAEGIEVVCGVLEEEAKEINKGFFKAREFGLPYITLKIAASLDGKIATKNFDSKWITSEKARQYSHHLRSVNDAILVGANTVKKDDPMLDCRIDGLEDFSPKRVILSSKFDFDLSSKIFQTAKKMPTIILTSARDYDFSKIKNLGVEIIFCEEKNGKVDLKNAMKKLCELGVNSVLVEGGNSVATQFLKENLVDEIIWILGKKIIGADGISAIGEMNFSKISEITNHSAKLTIKDFSDN